MFNNKFLKNDPLLEAVKGAQAEGAMRREAEKIVNEEFGVYSRKAVVREQLAAYDAALEKTYRDLKEGINIEPSEINPVPRKPEVGSGNVPHQTGSGKTINPKDNKEIAVESKKLAKKDYDKDGKIESPKDEVWGSRFRAAKLAGKMEEKKMWEAEDSSDGLPPSAAAKQAAKQTSTPASTPAPTKSKDLSSTFSSARGATGMQEAQINELSRTTLKSYVKKANRQANDLERKVNTRKDKPGEEDKMYRRIDGVNLAHDKMKVRVAATNEEALDEISKELAGRYIKKASRDALQHGAGYAGSGGDYKHLRKGANRVRGIEKAVDRLAKEETQIDEATRKHFRQHAADIAKISDQGERNKAASAAADTYARLNPRFDHAKFHKAAGSTAHETQTMKESIIAKLFAEQGF